MELGWIDFSTKDRDIVLGVLDILGEKGILDELGIAPIRDYFSDLFFPGTSTNQTRAKYFFIVPYILRDLESSKKSDFFNLKKELNNAEENCAHRFLDKNPKEKGIIGKNAINEGKWVNRPPSSIYSSGLRQYGIIKYNMSIDECIKSIIIQKKKRNKLDLGNATDKSEGSSDDKFDVNNSNLHFLNIPTYSEDWFNDLDINLTPHEGQFLKNQIISIREDSMFAYILKEELYEVLECESFTDLELIIDKFPENIQRSYFQAVGFSKFIFVLRVIYNDIISDGKNDEAKKWLNHLDLKKFSQINIDNILVSCGLESRRLEKFLIKSRDLMENEDIEGLKECIKSHEITLKGSRAKSLHIGEFDYNQWFGGGLLNYRFQNVKMILNDIHESEK